MADRQKIILVLAVIAFITATFLAMSAYLFRELQQMNFPDPDTVPREQWGRRIPFIDESVSGKLLYVDRDRDFVVARLDSGVKDSDFEPVNELKTRKWKTENKSIVCYWFPSPREYVVGCMVEPNAHRELALQEKIIEYSAKVK